MKKDNAVEFLLREIKNEQFAVLEENYTDKGKTNLKTDLQFKADRKKMLVGSFVGLTFEQDKKPFLTIKVSCHFEIKESCWKKFINKEEKLISVPKEFLAHLGMITVGTARGILFSKTENTVFNKFIIPTINVVNIVKSDAEFPL